VKDPIIGTYYLPPTAGYVVFPYRLHECFHLFNVRAGWLGKLRFRVITCYMTNCSAIHLVFGNPFSGSILGFYSRVLGFFGFVQFHS